MSPVTQESLVARLKELDKAYYELDSPLVSDEEYDELAAQYKAMTGELWMKTAEVLKPEMRRLPHDFPMLSLLKAKTQADLDLFTRSAGHPNDGVAMHLTPKVDGLGASCRFELNDDGEWALFRAMTRGDKQTGEDITEAMKRVGNFANPLPNLEALWVYDKIVVRGEVYLTQEAFEMLGGDNRRNAAAGLLRRKVPDEKTALLSYVTYRLYGLMGDRWVRLTNHYYWLKQLGFQIVPTTPYNTHLPVFSDMDPKVRFRDLPYETDGSVLCVTSPTVEAELGETSKYPRYAIALKFGAAKLETTVRAIEWTANRTGVVVPTFVFDPVPLGGAMVGRATGHNLKHVLTLDARPGDLIEVHRSNDVIPQVLRVVRQGEVRPNLLIPTRCPSCLGGLMILNQVHLVCQNPRCDEKAIGLFIHASGRQRLDLVGLGDELAIALVEAEVRTLPALYNLTLETLSTIVLPNGQAFGKTRGAKLLEAINASKNLPWPRVLNSLGCPGLGEPEGKLIAKNFSLTALLTMPSADRKLTLVRYEGIGETTAVAFSEWLDANSTWLYGLVGILKTQSIAESEPTHPQILEGQTWVVTGAYPQAGFRDRLEKTLKAYGAKVAGAVSKKTSKLVYGDDSETNNKYVKAKEIGITMLNELQLMELLDSLDIQLLEA